ncbi:MAG: hypothetical protein OHK93_000891 [Ramalina farinacea]|uniref:RING-type domain-containing protein n=1 Tax=Ramalina farinacea TaxID=258253 RepID=A0AA43TVM3_9LECA|nr:hypothetical protein [Ramalina farinacea]
MASYDIEHSVPLSTSNTIPSNNASAPPPRRPDFSTFFSHLSNTLPTNPGATTQNPHAHPMPTDISALYRLLAEGYNATRQSSSSSNDVLDEMISLLITEAEHPPTQQRGVDQDFLDSLERVPKKQLKRGMECPICGAEFLDDEFPLVVRLGCDERGRHVFDLECIAPWLRVHATCPLDRKDLVTRGKTEKEKGEVEEDEGEWDDMYA